MDPNILHNIGYGMYIASSNKGDEINGQIVNTVFQITNDPVTIAVSINKKNLTHEYKEASSRFSISILKEETPLSFIGRFGFKSGRNEDKFKGISFKKLSSGCPAVLEYSLGYLEAEVINRVDCGTHTLFIGQLVSFETLASGKPLTYDYYHQVKRGTTPHTAPTYIKEEESRRPKDSKNQRYRCTVRNYIY